MKTYIVKRPHEGDKWYNVGDERQARPGDVAHLVRNGVLVEPAAEPEPDKDPEPSPTASESAEAKAGPAPANKAEQAAPENKSGARKS